MLAGHLTLGRPIAAEQSADAVASHEVAQATRIAWRNQDDLVGGRIFLKYHRSTDGCAGHVWAAKVRQRGYTGSWA